MMIFIKANYLKSLVTLKTLNDLKILKERKAFKFGPSVKPS